MSKRVKALILCFLLLFTIVGGSILPGFCLVTEAATSSSGVLDDLLSAYDFDMSSYPLVSIDKFKEKKLNYSSVIQIAESETKELFIYTYEPVTEHIGIDAAKVRISVGENNKEYAKYSLNCISKEGVFKKYKVENFTIPNTVYRYYNILEIERPFCKDLDNNPDNTIINYVADSVGQSWCAYYVDGELKYEMQTEEVVEITPTLTDFLYLQDGVTWGSLVGMDSGCCSHYIAFNIENFSVDDIIDASMDYKYREFRTVIYTETGVIPFFQYLFGANTGGIMTTYPNGEGFKDVNGYYLSKNDVGTSNGIGLFAKQYTWNRIMKSSDFIKRFEDQGVQFSEDTKKTLQQSQYVFAFEETSLEYTSYESSNPDNPFGTTTYTTVIDGTRIAEVDIFRIKFVVDGKPYDLGVVSDTTTEDAIPGGVGSGLDFSLPDIFKDIGGIIALIVIIIIILIFIKPIIGIFKIIFDGIATLFRIILAPFKTKKSKRRKK